MTRQTYKDCSRFDFVKVVADRASQKLGQDRIHRRDFYCYLGRMFHLQKGESKKVLKELIERGLAKDSKRGIIFTRIINKASEEI